MFKKILLIILSVIDEKAFIDLVITVLENQAEKTKTKVDDGLVNLLRQYQAQITSKATDKKNEII